MNYFFIELFNIKKSLNLTFCYEFCFIKWSKQRKIYRNISTLLLKPTYICAILRDFFTHCLSFSLIPVLTRNTLFFFFSAATRRNSWFGCTCDVTGHSVSWRDNDDNNSCDHCGGDNTRRRGARWGGGQPEEETKTEETKGTCPFLALAIYV